MGVNLKFSCSQGFLVFACTWKCGRRSRCTHTMRMRTCVPIVVCVARKLRPCPSYSGRRDRNNSVQWRSLYKGGGVTLITDCTSIHGLFCQHCSVSTMQSNPVQSDTACLMSHFTACRDCIAVWNIMAQRCAVHYGTAPSCLAVHVFLTLFAPIPCLLSVRSFYVIERLSIMYDSGEQ